MNWRLIDNALTRYSLKEFLNTVELKKQLRFTIFSTTNFLAVYVLRLENINTLRFLAHVNSRCKTRPPILKTGQTNDCKNGGKQPIRSNFCQSLQR